MEKIRTILKILDRSSNKHFIKYQFFTTRFDRESVLDLLSRSIFSIQRSVYLDRFSKRKNIKISRVNCETMLTACIVDHYRVSGSAISQLYFFEILRNVSAFNWTRDKSVIV